MRNFIILVFLTLSLASCHRNPTPQPVAALLERVLPYGDDASRFECVLDTTSGEEFFTIACDGSKIYVKANSMSAMTAGINRFLQYHAGVDISWNSMTGRLPAELPVVAEERHAASVPLQYYLNFCTHSYTRAFWDEARWQQEIDLMALHGINMPLVTEGFECVWRSLLADRYGYTEPDSFLTGPAYFGWFFMNNMTGWGGPLPASWYEQRQALAKRMFASMGELGMKPVVPGYVGMVPHDFLEKSDKARTAAWKPEDVAPTGLWCGFTRPAIVADTARLREMAAAYYATVDSLYSQVLDTDYYAIDPFPAGGRVPDNVDCASSVEAMWQALADYDTDAVWVAQHWQENPKEYLTHSLPEGRLVILDLHADSRGDTICGGYSTDAAGTPHRWVYGMLNNYGGNTGLFGRAERVLDSFRTAVAGKDESNLAGIGAIPEGIENNQMLFDMLYALPWCDTVPSLETWLDDYAAMRYGLEKGSPEHSTMAGAWKALGRSVYACPSARQQGVTESVFLMRPDSVPGPVSSWALSSWYWDASDVREAADAMLSLAVELANNENYRYDLVDVVRQCVADKGKETLEAYEAASGARRDSLADRFMHLMAVQDTLSATIPAFRLDTWLARARGLGKTSAESDLYEKNARMLITTWGDRFQCETGGLHDYANREWSGLLTGYYAPRWRAWFANPDSAYDWFTDFEWPFVTGKAPEALPARDPVEAATRAMRQIDNL